MSATPAERYVPAAGRAAFTGVYDAVLAATMREARWRPALVAAVVEGLSPGATIADVGAGTGTLAVALAAARSDARVVAVDGDPRALAHARRKAGAGRVDWVDGLAGDLPLADDGADRVVLSLLLHHLAKRGREEALREVRRVLRPGGRLHVADWGRPRGVLSRAAFGALRLLDGREATRDHAAGRLPEVLAAAGFAVVRRQARVRTGWGTLELLAADG